MRHSRSEVSDARVSLLGPSQVALWDEHVAHRQHSQSSQLLRCVEHDGRESRGHLRVEADLDASLNFVLALHQQIEQLLRVDDRLSEIGHQSNQRGVPFVDDLREGS